MKLDRNINKDRRGKYALVLQRELNGLPSMMDHPLTGERCFVIPERALDFGNLASDFFVIRLKDKFAAPALAAYAMAAYDSDREYALEVLNLSVLAAEHPAKRMPD